ncbi:MAG: ABC transporter permease [Blastocatellia bacterium]
MSNTTMAPISALMTAPTSSMQTLISAWTNNLVMSLKLRLRERQTMFWTFLFPIFFLFIFAKIFAGGKPEGLAMLMGGLLCISAMAQGFFGMSIGLVTMRERGILRRYRLAPIKAWLIISSELVASYVMLMMTAAVQLAIARFAFGMSIKGNLVTLFIALTVGALAFLAIGFIVAGVADNARSAQVMSNVFYFPLMFLGGAAIPLQFLSPGMRSVSRLLPSRYMTNSLGRVITGGESLRAITPDLLVLGVTFIVSVFVAAKLFRWEAKEPMPWKQKAWAAAIVVVFVLAALLVK